MRLAADNTYLGPTTIAGGGITILHPHALGDDTVFVLNNGTSVEEGATLALDLGSEIVAEKLSFAGQGVNDVGALLNSYGNNTLAGPIHLAGDTTFNVPLLTALTISGVISGNGSSSFTKDGGGMMTLAGTNANTYTGITSRFSRLTGPRGGVPGPCPLSLRAAHRMSPQMVLGSENADASGPTGSANLWR